MVDIWSGGLWDVSGTEEVGWVADENRATGTRHVATTIMDGLYDGYVKVDRGIGAMHRL